jgi:hypothetical protein
MVCSYVYMNPYTHHVAGTEGGEGLRVMSCHVHVKRVYISSFVDQQSTFISAALPPILYACRPSMPYAMSCRALVWLPESRASVVQFLLSAVSLSSHLLTHARVLSSFALRCAALRVHVVPFMWARRRPQTLRPPCRRRRHRRASRPRPRNPSRSSAPSAGPSSRRAGRPATSTAPPQRAP